jgi:exosortase C (VPDSG-CTERM-specific)
MKEATSSVIRGRPEAAVASADTSHADRRRIGGLIFYVVALTLLFSEPLVRLVAHAFGNNLHSHIPLVPLIAAYLLYARPRGHVAPYELSVGGAVVSAAVGSGALVIGIALKGALSVNDEMAVLTLAYLGFLITGGFLFLGAKWMTSAAFPISFLVFMIPLPDAAVYWLERASVLASADASALLFKVTGTPLLRDGQVFALPGIVLQVAQECSGIRSSWVLFITSLLASHLFLESPWRRLILVAFVIPLGIVRNGFRILVIGLLCVHIGPHMIDSIIHRRGGPLFFLLSLVPLFSLLWWLRRQEQRGSPPAGGL